MAKQFGVSDEALAGLEDPERHPFPPPERAALRFATAMSRDGGEVPEDLFRDLRAHFGEAEIVEIACVVGLFNYFNRFNNALHVPITLVDPDVLIRRIEGAAAETGDESALRERAADILLEGRRYLRLQIDAIDRGRVVRRVRRGAAPPVDGDRAGGANVVAIRRGDALVGAIEAESANGAALSDEDRSLLERVAAILAAPGPGSKPG